VIVDLAGTWRLGWYDVRRGDAAFRDRPAGEQRDWPAASVPGEVHRDLVAAGVLAPLEPGLGVLAARWVEDATWIYAREFTVDGGRWSGC
jgi:beta-mannosidase